MFNVYILTDRFTIRGRSEDILPHYAVLELLEVSCDLIVSAKINSVKISLNCIQFFIM